MRSGRRRRDRQPWTIREQIADMREAMREELRGDPLPGQEFLEETVLSKPAMVLSRKADMQNVRESVRALQPDEQALLESLGRLEAAGITIAVREFPPAYRILTDDPAKQHRAIVEGFSLWSPRDMFEYIHLPEKQRQIFASFKRVFIDGTFEWEKWRDVDGV